jgi:hypothetical protein
MSAMIGRIEQGQVRLAKPVAGSEGQAVLVIPLPVSDPGAESPLSAPPEHLLDEDANEFRRRPETLSALNRGELA